MKKGIQFNLTLYPLTIKFMVVIAIVFSFPSYSATIVVNSNLDDGVSCTIRDAIESINDGTALVDGCSDSTSDGLGVDDKIIFDLDIGRRSIALSNGELLITSSMRIAATEGQGIELRAVNTRVININSNTTVTLDRINIRNGSILGESGGCISLSNSASLKFMNGKIENCSTNYDGGGVSVSAATLVVENSLIRGNSSNGGGGIDLDNGSNLEIRNTTISDNVANDANTGGGISAGNSTAVLSNVTIASNLSFADGFVTPNCCGEGAGLVAFGTSTITIRNSIIADSIKAEDCLAISPAIIVSDSSSIIESGDCEQASNLARTIDPRLLRLSEVEGGLAVHNPIRVSPARNSGDNATCEPIDQNGAIRPLTESDPCDVGAVERGFPEIESRLLVLPLKNGKTVIVNL